MPSAVAAGTFAVGIFVTGIDALFSVKGAATVIATGAAGGSSCLVSVLAETSCAATTTAVFTSMCDGSALAPSSVVELSEGFSSS
jgi:hypothetical protein